MGHSVSANDGYLVRAAADGTGVDDIVLDGRPERSSWCLIQRWRGCTGQTGSTCASCGYGLDGSEEREDGTGHCVGVPVSTTREMLYWTQKAKAHQGRILRANIDIPPTQTPASRTSIRTLYANLPEPIDFDLDAASQTLNWTDRGDLPLGSMCSRDVSAPFEPNANDANDANDAAAAKAPSRDTVLAGKFHEAIGLSLDLPGQRAFVADLNGSVYAVDLDSGQKEVLIEDAGMITGI
ncbi:hypothetical protein FIBSPDRAFT_853696, partial [Athelia psychrophila]